MVNTNKLKAKIVENGLNMSDFTEKINFDRSSFYRKLKDGGDKFTIAEIDSMSKALNLSKEDVNAIFFSQLIAEKQ